MRSLKKLAVQRCYHFAKIIENDKKEVPDGFNNA